MSKSNFLKRCRHFRDSGYEFLGLQYAKNAVSYLFGESGEIITLDQDVDSDTIRSIAQIFSLADFAERQLYRDCGIKALGNINLLPESHQAGD